MPPRFGEGWETGTGVEAWGRGSRYSRTRATRAASSWSALPGG